MAVAASTINVCNRTSVARVIKWSSLDTDANNLYFDVNTVDPANMVILLAGLTTLNNRWFVGTCSSASSQTSKVYPFFNSKLGPMKVQTTLVVDAQPQSIFRSTVVADTEVMGIFAVGPIETSRFKDSDGYIKLSRGITTVGGVSGSTTPFYACGLLV